MRCAIHTALISGRGQRSASVIAWHGWHLSVGRFVAARHKSYRLRLVERNGETDTAEHLLGDLLRRFHILPVRRLQAVCLVEHLVNLFLAAGLLQILLKVGLLLAQGVVLALVFVVDTGHRLHGDAV